MKKLFTLAFLSVVTLLNAQAPETDSRNWTVTKINNQDQIVSYPNEITVGPDGWLWITERTGNGNSGYGERVVRVDPANGTRTVMANLSSLVNGQFGQDGLMGMAIHPDLYNPATAGNNPYVYVAYTYNNASNRKLRIARFTYQPGSNDLDINSQLTVIDNIQASNDHNSGRLKIGPDGMLYYTVGDLGKNQFGNKCKIIQSQSLPTQSMVNNNDYVTYQGKTLRMTLTGGIPADNPKFVPFTSDLNNPGFPDNTVPDNQKVRSHIYSFGHRNAQGIIFGSNGVLYSSEHGDRVDDEVNIVVEGGNHGWPFIGGYRDELGYEYCIKVTSPNQPSDFCSRRNDCLTGATVYQEFDFPQPQDFVPPLATYGSTVSTIPQGGFRSWPTVAPASIDIYEGNGNIPWDTNLIIPTLKTGTLFRYELNTAGDAVTTAAIPFHSSIDRYRDTAISPDGNTIYAVTDSGGQTSGPTGTSGQNVLNPGAIFKFEYTSFPQPSNQVTGFTATSSNNTITLDWNDAIGTNIADGYVITVNTTASNLPALVDGDEVRDDLDLSDGSGSVLVKPGVETFTFSNLDEATTYNFEIHSFSNQGTDIDYLTTPAAPATTAVTDESIKLMLSEVVSTGLNGNDAVFVEIYNYGQLDIDLDAAGVYLGRQRAGNMDEFDLKLTGTLASGDYFIVARNATVFNNNYGFNPDMTGDANLLGGDGDDPYVITQGDFTSGTYQLLDTYGILGVDGTGEAWEFSNTRVARRLENSTANTLWTAAEWDIIDASNTTFNTPTPGREEVINFTYDNGWTPSDPSGKSLLADLITITNGNTSISSDTNAYRITVANSGILDLGTATITLHQNIINNGFLNGRNAIINVSGNVPQTIQGNRTANLGTLQVNNELTIATDVNIKTLLTINENLNLNTGTITTIQSDASGTAFVDKVATGATISGFGEVAVERYIPANRAFRFMASAVNGTGTIFRDWQNNGTYTAGVGTHISGSTTGANGLDATATGNASLYTYDNVNQAWQPVTNTVSNILFSTTAYRLMVRGDRDPCMLTSNNATPSNTTLTARGDLITGSINVPSLSNDAGDFNFIANPYAAPVDVELVLQNATNIDDEYVYFWDPTMGNGSYVAYDVDMVTGIPGSSINKYVQPNTSFFVKTLADNPNTNLAFAEAYKDINQELNDVFNASNHEHLAISLYEQTDFTAGGKPLDGLYIYNSPAFSDVINNSDAGKFSNPQESMAVVHPTGGLYSVLKENTAATNDEYVLSLKRYQSNNYVLSINNQHTVLNAYLVDNYLNTSTLLNNGANAIPFTIDSSIPASIDENRFKILFSNTTLSLDENTVSDLVISPNPFSSDDITLTGLSSAIKELTVYNVLGQTIDVSYNELNANSATIRFNTAIKSGIYLVKVTDVNDNSQTIRIIKK